MLERYCCFLRDADKNKEDLFRIEEDEDDEYDDLDDDPDWNIVVPKRHRLRLFETAAKPWTCDNFCKQFYSFLFYQWNTYWFAKPFFLCFELLVLLHDISVQMVQI